MKHLTKANSGSVSPPSFKQASREGRRQSGEKKCLPDPRNMNSFVARHITHLQVKEIHLYSQQALSQQNSPKPCCFSRLSQLSRQKRIPPAVFVPNSLPFNPNPIPLPPSLSWSYVDQKVMSQTSTFMLE